MTSDILQTDKFSVELPKSNPIIVRNNFITFEEGYSIGITADIAKVEISSPDVNFSYEICFTSQDLDNPVYDDCREPNVSK